MPTPITRITEPAQPLDAYSQGDTIIGHEASFYRDGSLTATNRPRPGVPGYEVPQEAAPEAPPLPTVQVAKAHLGREIQRLACRAEAGRRDLGQRFVFTAQGAQVSDPALLAMRAQLMAEIEATEAEIARLDGLDDLGVRQWAGARGVR
jgi:hypothetical protein